MRDDPDYEPPVRRMRPIDLLITGTAFAQLVVADLALTMEHIVEVLVGHANWQADQQDFADAVRREIESIPTKEK